MRAMMQDEEVLSVTPCKEEFSTDKNRKYIVFTKKYNIKLQPNNKKYYKYEEEQK